MQSHDTIQSGVELSVSSDFFFFNDTATTEIYTLSLHDALPISGRGCGLHRRRAPGIPRFRAVRPRPRLRHDQRGTRGDAGDRKSTRLNSSHANISYAVFCLKKKNKTVPMTLQYLSSNLHAS